MGANIKISSDSKQFINEMKLVTQNLKLMDSEFSVLTTKANLFGTEQDKLSAKSKELSNSLNGQNTILNLQKQAINAIPGDIEKYKNRNLELAKSIAEVEKQLKNELKANGENSEEYKKLTKELNTLRREYQDNAKEIEKSEKSLQNYKIKMNETEKSILQTKKALEETDKKLGNMKWDNASKSVETFGNKSKDIGRKLTLGISLPLLAIGGDALRTAADFEQGMADIDAVSNLTGEQFKQLHDLALKAGKDTAFSAKEASKGIEELVKAGVSVDDILNGGLISALNLATAGGLELGEAAEIASTALNAFKKDGLSVEQASNILAGGANASATSVQELKFGLSACSAVASGAGLSFKDASTALSVFANNGLKGSDAGTSFKTMIGNLIPKTKEQINTFKELGLYTGELGSAFYDAHGNIKPLNDIAGILHDSLKNLSAGERQMALESMFGSDAIRAGNILFNEGAEGVNKMYAEMSKVTAIDTAKKKLDTLKGSSEQLGGTWETLKIKLMESNTGPIKGFIDNLNNILSKFLDLDPAAQQTILVIGGILIAIGPLLMFIGQVAIGISSLIKLFSIVAPVIGAVSLPVLGVVIGIAALIAAGVALYQNWDFVKTKAMELWGWIGPYVLEAIHTILVSALGPLGEGIWKAITDFDSFKGAVAATMNGVSDYIGNKVEWVRNTLNNMFDLDIPHIKMPHFNITGKFSLDPPQIPSIGVEWYANGGIMTTPTIFGMNGANAMIGGEAGAEAILPLSQLWNQLSQNFDKLEQRLSQKDTVIIIQNDTYLDGEKIGSTVTKRVIKNINNTQNSRNIGRGILGV